MAMVLAMSLIVTPKPVLAMPPRIRPREEDGDGNPRAHRPRAQLTQEDLSLIRSQDLIRQQSVRVATRVEEEAAGIQRPLPGRQRGRQRGPRNPDQPLGLSGAEASAWRRLHGPLGTHKSFVNVDTEKLAAIDRHDLGERSECEVCGALLWQGERTNQTPCCADGQVRLRPLPNAPDPLCTLMTKNAFKQSIRSYNNSLAMASHTGTITHFNGGTHQFKINGEMRHRVGSLLPGEGQESNFAQIYMLDPEEAAARRLGIFPQLDFNTLSGLQRMLCLNNPYVKSFQSVREQLREADVGGREAPNLEMKINSDGVPDVRRYNAPTGLGQGEIAGFIEEGQAPAPEDAQKNREIVIKCREGTLRYISDCHPSYHPLRYPLIWPCGGVGWHPNIPKERQRVMQPIAEDIELRDRARGGVDDGLIPVLDAELDGGEGRAKNVSCRQWLAYHIQDRGDQSHLLKCGKLLQEFAVDGYCQTENQRTGWVRLNQSKIRAECYQNVVEARNEGKGSRNVMMINF